MLRARPFNSRSKGEGPESPYATNIRRIVDFRSCRDQRGRHEDHFDHLFSPDGKAASRRSWTECAPSSVTRRMSTLATTVDSPGTHQQGGARPAERGAIASQTERLIRGDSNVLTPICATYPQRRKSSFRVCDVNHLIVEGLGVRLTRSRSFGGISTAKHRSILHVYPQRTSDRLDRRRGRWTENPTTSSQ